MKRSLQLAIFALFLAPTAALAHVGVGNTSGFMHGFMHPLSGLDHQLAMTLVGVFAYQLGGRALWLVPLTFVSVMALGGFLGVAGSAGAVRRNRHRALGDRARRHCRLRREGSARGRHGRGRPVRHLPWARPRLRMPLDASGFEYGIGFMLATALLHAVGIFIGMLIGLSSRTFGNNVDRLAGGLASVAGVALLLGYV